MLQGDRPPALRASTSVAALGGSQRQMCCPLCGYQSALTAGASSQGDLSRDLGSAQRFPPPRLGDLWLAGHRMPA